MKEPSKYASYVRVSTASQGRSGLGLESQRSIIAHFYPNIEHEFLEIRSAKNVEDRVVLQEAIKYCKENDCILVVAKVDRLTRNVEDGLKLLRELDNRIAFCDLPGQPDKFTLTLFMAFAEREKMLISLRTREGLAKSKKAKGSRNPSGNRTAWGINHRESSAATRRMKAMMNPDREKARQLAIALKDTTTLEGIAQKLNSSGFPTLSGYGVWSKGTVSRLLNEKVL